MTGRHVARARRVFHLLRKVLAKVTVRLWESLLFAGTGAMLSTGAAAGTETKVVHAETYRRDE